MTETYLEDFAPGQMFRSEQRHVTAEDIRRFAEEFDPQPFHLDEEGGKDSVFGGLVASGWHTGAMTMRLLVGSNFRPAGGLVGAALEELAWPRPVRPGDVLQVTVEVLETRPSRSKPDRGLMKVRTTTRNQDDEPVQIMVSTIVVKRRPSP